MRLSAARHRLLLSLARAQRTVTLSQLAADAQVPSGHAHRHLMRLREAGLVCGEYNAYRLRPGVVVGERFVGYVVPLDLTPWGKGVEVAASA